jgi:hypothetical protein
MQISDRHTELLIGTSEKAVRDLAEILRRTRAEVARSKALVDLIERSFPTVVGLSPNRLSNPIRGLM